MDVTDRALRKSDVDPIALGNTYFLSNSNPMATAHQREIESQLLEALDMPEIAHAKTVATQRWTFLMGQNLPPEAMRDFDEIMEQFTVRFLTTALNYDSNYPGVLNNINGPAHHWFGLNVPGGRCAGLGENPDVNYACSPIDGFSRFELHGKVMNPAIGDCPVNVAGDLIMTDNTASLDWRDLEMDSEGRFVITISPEPANGRRNHIQTVVDSRWLYTRDVYADWNQRPNGYRVYRVDPPTGAPATLESKVTAAAGAIIREVGECFMYRQLIFGLEENTLSSPRESTGFGGRMAQRVGRARLNLKDDEAYIITLDPDGAGYHNLVVNDWWLRTIDYWNHTSSLNNTQSHANPDGTYTYVISLQDPGVHNWLDTTGLHQTLTLIRFQLLPRDADGNYRCSPDISGKLVKLDDLDKALPPGMKRISRSQRQAQLANRLASHNRRFEA
jgi:hypothetical protein